MKRLAERMARLGTETAFEVLARARELEARGREVVHLEIGEPDYDTPAHVVEAAVKALRDGHTHYTPAAGIPELREAIARYVSESRGIQASPAEVVVTPGGKPILFFAMLALLEEGDDVIYPNPGFPIYESMIHYLGARAVPLRLRESLGFRLDVEELGSLLTPRTKLVVLNSPANPTGGVLTREDVGAIAALCRQADVWVLSDEIYSRILYRGRHHSLAAQPGMKERTILLDGFSKTYAMTGWRLGYGVMPEELARAVTRLMINSNSCTAAFSQVAAVAALEGPQEPVDLMVAEFTRRRAAIVGGLNALPGVTCPDPAGAFYVFPNVTALGRSSRELQDHLLEEVGVATLAGTAFGSFGEGYLRLSYATSLQNIERALERMAQAVSELRPVA